MTPAFGCPPPDNWRQRPLAQTQDGEVSSVHSWPANKSHHGHDWWRVCGCGGQPVQLAKPANYKQVIERWNQRIARASDRTAKLLRKQRRRSV